MNDSWIGEQETIRAKSAPAPAPRGGSGSTTWVLVGVALLVLGLVTGWGGYQLGNSPVAGFTKEKETTEQQLAQTRQTDQGTIALLEQKVRVLATHHTCYPYSQEIGDFEKLVNRGQYTLAATLADAALTNPVKEPCAGSVPRLATLWYQSATTALWGTPATNPFDTTSVARWKGIEHEAQVFGVAQQVSPTTCFSLSFDNQNWPLAQACFAESVQKHLVGVQDSEAVSKYFAVLVNWGKALLQVGTPPGIRHAGVLLATANAISRHGLGRGEAAASLTHQFGHHLPAWVHPDPHDAVLRAEGGKG